jgi:hypothetical protein
MPKKRGPMSRAIEQGYTEQGYIEWEGKADTHAPAQRPDERARVASLFDREIRRRVGELIARAKPEAGEKK